MKLNELKVELAKQILASENETELLNVDLVLNHSVGFELSKAQKAALDESHRRLLRGEAKTYTPEQMIRRVRKAVKR